MLFDRPEAGRRTLLLQVELRKADNPDEHELAELARSADLIVVDTAHGHSEKVLKISSMFPPSLCLMY